MYNNNKRGYNPLNIGIQEHDVSGVEAALENNKLVIHLPVSVLVPIKIKGVIVPPSRYKNENRTRGDLNFTNPNLNLSKDSYKKLGDVWVPHRHSFIVGNRVYTIGETTQKDQGLYATIAQDITGIHYNGDLRALADGLNQFFEANMLCLMWTQFVPKDEKIAGQWFIGPSGEHMSIRRKDCKAA